ncbi:EAL domain-containing protein [Vibrio hannami]|uniref:bifunctional diguanylate cyclase/phosphodiesterase n=1 Tax=Vibrio hannami TaxID=2717094 RepID=UPI0024106347|nr:EAL domain-containing protein [Vibrio hannami]MDG3084911.1 EAL domain-containing protein [Vibrio hannami]
MMQSLSAKKSLRGKLFFYLMLLAALLTLVTSLVFTVYELNSTKESEADRIHSISEILAPNLTASILFQDTDTVKELITPLIGLQDVAAVIIYDANGDVFLRSDPGTQNTKDIYGELTRFSTQLSLEGTDYGDLVIWTDNTRLDNQANSYIRILFVMLLLSLAVSFWVSLYLSRIFTKPIIGLVDVAEQVTKSNNYKLRVTETQRGDELGVLTHCFNTMLEEVEHRDLFLESQVQERTKELKTQVYRDPLSGLPNRRYILEQMNSLVESESVDEFTLMYLDLDGFKDVNDNLGHDVGDELLRYASKRIESVIRRQDTLARLGGDEFTVLMDGTPETFVLDRISKGILKELAKPFNLKGESIRISASIGICQYPHGGKTTEEVLKNADIAMYESKAAGRNTVNFFATPMLQKLQYKRQTINDLREAIQNREFELHYQPIVNLLTGEIQKAEALIRWNHPDKGIIFPDEFIYLAEESGLVDEISCLINEQAFSAVRQFREFSGKPINLSINVSPILFDNSKNWFAHFNQCLDKLGEEECPVFIEITENVLMTSDESTLMKLKTLKSKGVHIAIDDFGVGYSSLSYLHKLDADILKVDKSFVQSIDSDQASNTLCRTFLPMAQGLNMNVVAEGIETAIQRDRLVSYGYLYGQGHYYSEAVCHSDFMRFLEQKVAVGQ